MARRRKVRNYAFLKGFDFYIPGWVDIFILIAFLILGAVLGGIVLFLLGLFSPSIAVTYGTLISNPIVFLPGMVYASFRSRQNAVSYTGLAIDSRHYGKSGFWGLALLVIPATIGAAYLTDPLTSLLPPMPDKLKAMMEGLTGGPLWISLLSVSVMAPFFEEWLCRGEVMRGLLTRMKPVWAILISSAFFAIIHLNPWQALPAFILGCLFGYVYYKTGSLKLTMLMHCVNNTFSVICTRIDAFRDADTWLDVLTPAQYGIGCVFAVAFVVLLILLLRRIPMEGRVGNCDEVSA